MLGEKSQNPLFWQVIMHLVLVSVLNNINLPNLVFGNCTHTNGYIHTYTTYKLPKLPTKLPCPLSYPDIC